MYQIGLSSNTFGAGAYTVATIDNVSACSSGMEFAWGTSGGSFSTLADNTAYYIYMEVPPSHTSEI
jgi:hypothetical protein